MARHNNEGETMEPEDSEQTISIDKKSFDYWRGKVDSVLANINRSLEEICNNVKDLNEWKGAVVGRIEQADMRITAHDVLLSKQADAIKTLADQTHKALGTVETHISSANAKNSKEDENSLTFKWLIEKFGLPITVAAITFFLFTIMPGLFILLYILPKLAQAAP